MTATHSALFAFSCLLVSVVARPSSAQTIYWTDLGTSKIQRVDLSAGVVEDLVTSPQVFSPVDIALDLAGGKMYWTDSALGDLNIVRADLNGSNRELFVTGLLSPSGIALALRPEGVPTLSEWGLVWMTLTLVALGAVLLISPRDLRANSMD